MQTIVDCKHSSLVGGWCFGEVNGSYGVGLWKFIIKVGGSSLGKLDLRWGMAPRLDLDMVWYRE